MSIKLRCKLFGHDFRIITIKDYRKDGHERRRKTTSHSKWCRHCGLDKEELLQLGAKGK